MSTTKHEFEIDYAPIVNGFNAIKKEVNANDESIQELSSDTNKAFNAMQNEAKKYGNEITNLSLKQRKVFTETKDQVQVIRELTAARKASNDPAQIAIYNRQIDDARNKIKALNAEQRKGAKENQEDTKKSVGLITQLLDKQRKLTEARDRSNSPELIKRYNRLIDETKNKLNELTNVQQKAAAQPGFFGNLKNGLLSVFGGNLLFSAVNKLRQNFSDAINVSVNFQKSIQNLSAITGASGRDLTFYGQQAIEMGRHIEGGAVAAVEAFKLIGSAKPELLKNKEALVQVTEAAVKLAQASGLTLPEAAENLGTALNAFNAPAQDAGKFINVMAAAAQLGAKEIPFVTFALSKFGGVAKSAGVSIEESAAAIELLGAKIPQAEAVGTNLRNILIILQAEASKQGRSFKGLRGELDLLAPKIKDIAFLEKTFGRDNLLATQTLIQQREELSKLSTEVEGTNSAYEQAATNTNTLAQGFTELSNAYDLFLLSLSKSSFVKGKIKGFLDGLTAAFIDLSEAINGTFFETQNIAERELRKLTQAFVEGKTSTSEYADAVKFLLLLNPKLAKSIASTGEEINNNAETSIGIIGQLKKEIQELNESLDSAKTVTEINKITSEIKAKQKQLDALLGKANDDIKRAKDEFERAIADLRKRANAASLDAVIGEERVTLEMKFQEEELQLLKDHLIKLGLATNSHFKLSNEQLEQFKLIEKQIHQKAADDIIKIELDKQNKLNDQIKTGNELSIQELENAQNAAVNGINSIGKPKGVSEVVFEEQKQKQILKINQQYSLKILELKRQNLEAERNAELKLLDIKVQQGQADAKDIDLLEKKFELQFGDIQNQKDAIQNQINQPEAQEKFSMAKLLGVTESDMSNISTAFHQTYDFLSQTLDLQITLTNQQISLSQQRQDQYENEIQTLEASIDREIQLNTKGKANNIQRITDEIALKKAQKAKEEQIEAEALEKRRIAQKKKLDLDTALQASNLITASTEILAATAGGGPVGVAIGIATVLAMLGFFIAAKQQAYQAIKDDTNTRQFSEGEVDIKGPGTGTSDSIHAKVSKGESVITAQKTKEHKKLLVGIHNEDESMMKAGILDLIKNKKISLSEDLPELITTKKEVIRQNEISAYLQTDNSKLESELKEVKEILFSILDENKQKTFNNPNGDLVHKKGAHTKIIRK